MYNDHAAAGGALGILAVNERRPGSDYSCDSWVPAAEEKPGDTAPFSLQATLWLTPAAAPSEDTTDLLFANPPTATDAALRRIAFELNVATTHRVGLLSRARTPQDRLRGDTSSSPQFVMRASR